MEKIKYNFFKFLNLIIFLGIVINARDSINDQDPIKTFNTTSTESKLDDFYQNTIFGRKYDFFLPIYDFQRPYKFRKEQYSKIMKYASDFKKKQEVPKDVYIMSDDLIHEYEEVYKKQILYRIINKEVNLEEVVYDNKFDIYAYPDISAYREEQPKFLVNDEIQMKNYDDLGNYLRFSPKKIEVNDK